MKTTSRKSSEALNTMAMTVPPGSASKTRPDPPGRIKNWSISRTASDIGNSASKMPRSLFVSVVILAAVISNLTFSAFTSTKKSNFIFATEIDRALQLRGNNSTPTPAPVSLTQVMTMDDVEIDEGEDDDTPVKLQLTAQLVAEVTKPPAKEQTKPHAAKSLAASTTSSKDKKTQQTTIHDINKEAPYAHLKDGAFIHLGKTGGSTLAGLLRDGCHSFLPHPCENHPIIDSDQETQASLKTPHYYHIPDFIMLPFHPVREFYIVTLRDPLERTKSAFVYSHPKNDKTLKLHDRGWQRVLKMNKWDMDKVMQCFPTLEQFVQNIGDGNAYRNFEYPWLPKQRMILFQDNCTNFARAAMNHRIKPMVHLEWNLEHIYESMNAAWNQTVIFATRQEHMAQDWQSLNHMLGETKDTTKFWPEKKVRDVSKVQLPVPNELSEEGRVQLCRALRGEYQRYVEYLFASVNLSPQDRQDSLEFAKKSCGDQLDFLNAKDPLAAVLANPDHTPQPEATVPKGSHLPNKAKATATVKKAYTMPTGSPSTALSSSKHAEPNESAAYSHLKTGAFIHLSQTGGDILSGFLKYGCHSFMPKPCPNKEHIHNETIVSIKTKQYYHIPDFHRLPPTTTEPNDFYMVSLRDPLERTKAAFVHGHPANEKALGVPDPNWGKMLARPLYSNNLAKLTKCFDTLENFVAHLGDGNDVHNYVYNGDAKKLFLLQKNCTDFARAVMDHKVRPLGKLFWNLEHIYERMEEAWNGTVIFTTRQEHLVADWASTNELLGETMDTTQLWPPEMGSADETTLPVPNKLSEKGRIQLCRALRGEYKRYIQVLQASANLSPQDVEESLVLARKSCGDQLEFLNLPSSISIMGSVGADADGASNQRSLSNDPSAKKAASSISVDASAADYKNLENGAFIHLGKTGGSTLAGFLRHGCHQFLPQPCPWHTIMNSENETMASVKTRYYFHLPDFPNLGKEVHDFYIVTLRDPYERTRSGFVYGHPANDRILGIKDREWRKLLKKNHKGNMGTLTKCFPTLEQFVQHLGDGNDVRKYRYPLSDSVNGLHQKDCTNFARAAMNHRVRPMGHLFWNLEHIYEHMAPRAWNNTVIFATRQEQIVQDWESLNHMLGETKDTVKLWPEKKARDVSKVVLPVPNELSEEGRVQLCRALRGEYERYIEFLKASVNLTPKDVEESLATSRKNCGDQLDFL